jgi:hypothetical protein
MRFKPLKNLTLGKTKETPEKEGDEFKEIAANRIADMEKRIHVKTKDLEEKVQQIQELSPKSEDTAHNGDIPNGPHGPIKELKVEEDNLGDVISLADMSEDEEAETDGEVIKLVEVHAAAVQPQEKEEAVTPAEASAAPEKPEETEKETKPEADEDADSLNNLFSDQEEEENPLANLINSLPDVTTGELMDDLNEIKVIIKEWQNK